MKSFNFKYVGGLELSPSSKSLNTAVNLLGSFDVIFNKEFSTSSYFSSGIQTSPSMKFPLNLHLFKFENNNFSCKKYNLYMSYLPGMLFSPILSLKKSFIDVSTVFK